VDARSRREAGRGGPGRSGPAVAAATADNRLRPPPTVVLRPPNLPQPPPSPTPPPDRSPSRGFPPLLPGKGGAGGGTRRRTWPGRVVPRPSWAPGRRREPARGRRVRRTDARGLAERGHRNRRTDRRGLILPERREPGAEPGAEPGPLAPDDAARRNDHRRSHGPRGVVRVSRTMGPPRRQGVRGGPQPGRAVGVAWSRRRWVRVSVALPSPLASRGPCPRTQRARRARRAERLGPALSGARRGGWGRRGRLLRPPEGPTGGRPRRAGACVGRAARARGAPCADGIGRDGRGAVGDRGARPARLGGGGVARRVGARRRRRRPRRRWTRAAAVVGVVPRRRCRARPRAAAGRPAPRRPSSARLVAPRLGRNHGGRRVVPGAR